MIRTFIAVEFEPNLRHAIAGIQESLKREWRRLAPGAHVQWVRAESIHLTLKFLGDIEESRATEIVRVLDDVASGYAPFALQVSGVGVFPDERAPRVVWMGLSGRTDQLIRLAASLDAALVPSGFTPEQKPYSPHVTIARVKDRQRDIGKALTESGVLRESRVIGEVTIRALTLMKSELMPSGSIYTRLGRVPLGDRKVSLGL